MALEIRPPRKLASDQPSPQQGIYYVVFHPSGWQLMARKFGQDDETDHATWWEERLASWLAAEWAGKLGVRSDQLAAVLRDHHYSFPRGRVSRAANFLVLHGADLKHFMKVTKRSIESEFGVRGQCRWLFDDHEQCQKEDQEAVCRLLGIHPLWGAV
jgi:hypothetical protein